MPPTSREELDLRLLSAAREYSTAAVLLHTRVAAGLGLSASDLKALDVLQRSGPRSAGELSKGTGLTRPAVTALLDRLERKKLVRRSRDPRDGRGLQVHLTRAFERAIPRRFESLNSRVRARFRRYTDTEVELAVSLLRSVASAMREELDSA